MGANQNNQPNKNQKNGTQTQKPKVTKTVVTKKPVSDSSKPSGGSRPNSGGKPGSSGSRPNSSGKPGSSGSRPNSSGKPGSSGSRPNSGGKPGSSGSRPNSGGKPGSSGSRPNSSGRTGNYRSADHRNIHNRKPDSRKRPLNRRRPPNRRRHTNSHVTLIGALIVGILLAIIITGVMRANLLKTRQIAGEYYLGTNFDISNYVEPENEKAVIIFDNASFQPEGIGEYKVEYTVQCGKLKSTKKITINVADADIPLISGPDTLAVIVGEEICWSDYYRVVDSQPNLEEALVAAPAVDTSEVGQQEITLSVVDWYNNSSTKTVTVKILDLQGKYLYAAKAARKYKQEQGLTASSSGLYVYTADKDNLTYVLVDDNVIYTFADQETCNLYEYDVMDETAVNAFSELIIEIKTNGEKVDVVSISDFM